MTSLSSYQPFLIGKFTSGQFQYLQPWQGPVEAFQPMVNAYSYRGSIYKREGYQQLGHTGSLRYQDNIEVDLGDGGASYSGTIANHPLDAGTVTFTAITVSGLRTATDDGIGNLVGTLAAAGSTINYITGAWVLNTTANIANPKPIIAQYTYTPNALATPFISPIMGINYWIDEATNAETMTVEDQKRLAIYNTNTKLFDPVSCIAQDSFTTLAATSGTGPFTFSTQFTNLAPYSVNISDGTDTIQDDGVGGFLHNGNALPDGTNFASASVVYATGVITFSLVVPADASYFVTANLAGDYFTGGDTNFFNFTNWKATDGEPGYEYLVNNKDPVTLFDGSCLLRPAFPILEVQIVPHVNGIVTALDVKVYKNRLLLIRPTVFTFDPTGLTVTGTILEAQDIRFSSEFYTFGTSDVIPFDFVADVSGHGGLTEAPTGDWIMAAQFLRDALIVFFAKSTWIFRFTGSAFSPFRWDQLNGSRNTNAPYGSIEYDVNATSMGTKGLISCDGVSVDRYDELVIDQYTDIDNDNFIQCIARKDDILNQSWMIYPSTERKVSLDQFSDKAIIYNFLENSFTTYQISLSTLGVVTTFEDITWADFAPGSGSPYEGLTWQQANFTWDKYISQNLAPAIYGGDQNGIVYTLNVTETDNGRHIDVDLTSNRWNPFMESGERCRFGYIDFYYQINPDVTLVIDIFVNNSKTPNITKELELTGPDNDDFAWKRLQVNMQGEFIRISISTPILRPGQEDEDLNNGSFIIPGIILWAASAGRLVPGRFA